MRNQALYLNSIPGHYADLCNGAEQSPVSKHPQPLRKFVSKFCSLGPFLILTRLRFKIVMNWHVQIISVNKLCLSSELSLRQRSGFLFVCFWIVCCIIRKYLFHFGGWQKEMPSKSQYNTEKVGATRSSLSVFLKWKYILEITF